jgi:hypothetical protein
MKLLEDKEGSTLFNAVARGICALVFDAVGALKYNEGRCACPGLTMPKDSRENEGADCNAAEERKVLLFELDELRSATISGKTSDPVSVDSSILLFANEYR